MKYSNLTTDVKILKWFKKYPSTINDKCPTDGHIVDWILGGYRGKVSAKKNLINSLIKQSVDFSFIRPESFLKLLELFIDSYKSNKEPDYEKVYEKILTSKEQLQLIKTNNDIFLGIISGYNMNTERSSQLVQQIIFSDIPALETYIGEENNRNHPVIFLLTEYINSLDLKLPDTISQYLKLKKINAIHRLNENIIYAHIPLLYKVDNDLKINYTHSVLEALEEIKNTLEHSSIPSLDKHISLIDEIIKRDLYRSLNLNLSNCQPMSKKTKI